MNAITFEIIGIGMFVRTTILASTVVFIERATKNVVKFLDSQ